MRANLKSGSVGIVARLKGNVARLDVSVFQQVTEKNRGTMVRWRRITETYFLGADLFQILSNTFTINIDLVSE